MSRIAAALFLLLVPTAASAHVGVGDTSGIARGFLHPIGGFDHVLTMVAVGLFAVGEALYIASRRNKGEEKIEPVRGSLWMTSQDWARSWKQIGRAHV